MAEGGEVIPLRFERQVLKKVEYPERMSHELVTKWAFGIPASSEAYSRRPEWQ